MLGELGPLVPVSIECGDSEEAAAVEVADDDVIVLAPPSTDEQRSQTWSEEEDHMVRSLVVSHGIKHWSLIAASLHGRTGKQCRERWHNQLDPVIKKNHWTPEEDRILLDV